MCWFFFTWQAFAVFLVLHYLAGMVGITFGFHRLLAHKGFQASKPLEYFASFCGTLACQGGPISWIGQHRVHHAYSDKPEDPHDMKKGFWHSHIGFIFYLMLQGPSANSRPVQASRSVRCREVRVEFDQDAAQFCAGDGSARAASARSGRSWPRASREKPG